MHHERYETGKDGRQADPAEILADELARALLGRSNDCVKLAFLEGEDLAEQIDALDLSLLSEFRRNANGAVEIRLVDRVKALGELLALRNAQPAEACAEDRSERLYRALECRAGETEYD